MVDREAPPSTAALVQNPRLRGVSLAQYAGVHAALAEGFDFVALGRALIHTPDFIAKLRSGELRASGCTHCNRCVVEMDRGGTRCVL